MCNDRDYCSYCRVCTAVIQVWYTVSVRVILICVHDRTCPPQRYYIYYMRVCRVVTSAQLYRSTVAYNWLGSEFAAVAVATLYDCNMIILHAWFTEKPIIGNQSCYSRDSHTSFVTNMFQHFIQLLYATIRSSLVNIGIVVDEENNSAYLVRLVSYRY